MIDAHDGILWNFFKKTTRDELTLSPENLADAERTIISKWEKARYNTMHRTDIYIEYRNNCIHINIHITQAYMCVLHCVLVGFSNIDLFIYYTYIYKHTYTMYVVAYLNTS